MNRAIRAAAAATILMASTVPGAAGRGSERARSADTETAAVPGDSELVNFEHVANFPTVAAEGGKASDIEFYTTNGRDYAVMGSYDGGAWVYDITDPENPRFAVNIPCNQRQNDVQIKQFGDRWILALARDGIDPPCVATAAGGTSGGGIAVFDITDPLAFQAMYNFRTTGGAHNFTFHPTKPFGWVSTGDLPGGSNHIPIIDFANVDAPVLAADIPIQGGPHDITFTADGLQAFVAAENNYRIYDTTDPKAPVPITSNPIPNAGTYAHGFDPTPDRKLAIATNESLALGGFFAPSSGVCPGEGLTFYGIEGDREQDPVRLGSFLADVTGPVPPGDDRVCTGHVGKLGNKSMTLGWYIGGVRVVDYSDPSAPVEIGSAVMPGAEVWAAKWYKGPYVYASDLRRGFDVFRWTGAQPPPWQDGVPIIPDPTAPARCASPTLVGGTGNSQLTGTPGNDVIVDMDGDNAIRGNGGNDVVCTGPGDDDVVTKNGADVIVDQGGRNRIVTGGGRDIVTSGNGRDVIRSGAGRDRISSRGGKDTLAGGGGNDTLRAGSGKDVLNGGSGRDTCKPGRGKNRLGGCEA